MEDVSPTRSLRHRDGSDSQDTKRSGSSFADVNGSTSSRMNLLQHCDHDSSTKAVQWWLSPCRLWISFTSTGQVPSKPSGCAGPLTLPNWSPRTDAESL